LAFPGPIQAAVVPVGVSGFTFSPSSVTINQNDQVKWTWSGFHSTTSDTSLWDSTILGPSGSFTQTFPTAGSFPYHLMPHQSIGMVGTVTVQSAANLPPSVSITSPTNGASFTAPWNGTIDATASDSDGSVAKVDFFAGATVLGTVSNPGSSLSFQVQNL